MTSKSFSVEGIALIGWGVFVAVLALCVVSNMTFAAADSAAGLVLIGMGSCKCLGRGFQ